MPEKALLQSGRGACLNARNLEEFIDEWIIFRLRNGLEFPGIRDHVIKEPENIEVE